jgi:DNA-binding MarR family transcriptional regulator
MGAHPVLPRGAILARISRIHLGWKRHVQRGLAPYGVNAKQFHVLRKLAERGSLLPSEVATMLHADRPTVSALLRTMERANWIRIATDPEDRRRRRIVLHRAGRGLLQRIPEGCWRQGHTAVDPEACLTDAERRQLHALLGRMCGTLGDPAAGADPG